MPKLKELSNAPVKYPEHETALRTIATNKTENINFGYLSGSSSELKATDVYPQVIGVSGHTSAQNNFVFVNDGFSNLHDELATATVRVISEEKFFI